MSLMTGGSGERCLFSLHENDSLKDFLKDLQQEDPNITSASLYTKQGERISGSTLLRDILDDGFVIKLNDKTLSVKPETITPPKASAFQATALSQEATDRKMEEIKREMAPLLQQKIELDKRATRYTNGVMWAGLGFLTAQWCFMARLTWWEFNWDIMEPVTYFVTFGTGVLSYAYFAIQKRDYTFPDLRESILVRRMFKNYIKNDFDVDRYFALEHKLKKLDPLAVQELAQEIEEEEEEAKINGNK